MKSLNAKEKSYYAGVFDSQGCFCIDARGVAQTHFHSSKNKKQLLAIKKLCGGSLYFGHAMNSWKLTLGVESTGKFFNNVELFIKYRQQEIDFFRRYCKCKNFKEKMILKKKLSRFKQVNRIRKANIL